MLNDEKLETTQETQTKNHYFTFPDIKLLQNTYDVQAETPENVELEGRIKSLELYKTDILKLLIFYLLTLITATLFYLLSRWIPILRVKFTLKKSSIAQATYVVVYGADKTVEILPLTIQNSTKETTKVFEYRLFKYSYNFDKNKFIAAQFDIGNKTTAQIHYLHSSGLDQQSYDYHLMHYGKNQTDIPMKPWYRLLVEEVLTPFYIFQLYSVLIWCFDDYELYSFIIIFFSLISITVSLTDNIRARKKLREMAYYEEELVVHRKNLPKEKISSSMIVPGDIFEVPEQQKMPCDAILLSGTCIMNEAMLTGESIPVIKNPLPSNNNSFNFGEDKQFALYAGTFCIRAKNNIDNPVYAMAIRTGFTTVKGELIRTMMFPKPSNFKFYHDSFKFIGILAIMSIAEFVIDYFSFVNGGENSAERIILKCSEIITVTVPPALPTCMSIGISVALKRLQKKKIFCIADQKINEAGRVNVMCFDKTGTLTEDGLDILGVRPVKFDQSTNRLVFDSMIRDIPSLSNINEIKASYQRQLVLEILASCHSITKIEESTGKFKLIGDPLDVKMYESTKWDLMEGENIPEDMRKSVQVLVKPNYDGGEYIAIYRRFEFASKLQRMSVIVKKPSENNFKLFIKGSPEKIRELSQSNSVPPNFHQMLMKYTEDGYRVLGVAIKTLNLREDEIHSINREDIENELTFLGFLIMENKLKPITTQIIDVLHKAAIRTIMVTGDNVLTAISVARQCSIVKSNQRIFLGELSENKINDNYFIIWKDFEFSESRLHNESLEPELDILQPPKDPIESFGLVNEDSNTTNAPDPGLSFLTNNDTDQNRANIHDMDASYIAIEPPFEPLELDSNYVIALTGRTFSFILKEIEQNKNEKYEKILDILLKKAVVFARMHPDEKALMITKLQTVRKNIVGMCGDGANDCAALKAANVGISLSEAEASIAAPFTSQVQDISCVVYLLRNGRAALATSFQCFKYMALYSIIQSTTVTIVYYWLLDLQSSDYYYIDIFIILPLSFTMGMTGVFKKLTIYQPTGRLISVPILVSVIGQAVIQILAQIGILIWVVIEYDHNLLTSICQDDLDNGGIPCPVDTSIFMVSIFQYTIVVFAFMVGRPFRKPVWTNFWFMFFFIILMVCNVLIVLNPFGWTFFIENTTINLVNSLVYGSFTNSEGFIITHPPFVYKIFGVCIINSILTILWERLAVKYISLAWKKRRDHAFKQNLSNNELTKQ